MTENPLTGERAARAGEEEVRASLALSLLPEPLLRDKVALVRQSGSCWQALARGPVSVPPAIHRKAEEERQSCARLGLSLVPLTSPDYPALLKEIVDPPLVLYVWGSLEPSDELSLAVVGSRRASPYGIQVGEGLTADLASRGLAIVSGLARGIDAVAHRAALAAGKRTLAVLGSGLDVIYPAEHRRLAGRIARKGAVLSELPLTSPPLARHFPRRNRIVSGLALGTLVIEADERSGSLISARHALDQGREVFAVPGPVGSATSRGVHRLIQDGANLVTGVDDVIEELTPEVRRGLSLQSQEPPCQMGDSRDLELDPLAPDERALLGLIRQAGTIDVDTLVELARMPPEG
ncbi:MAG: DNA-processing protein DprA, partial [Acidobacteriota bacterium]